MRLPTFLAPLVWALLAFSAFGQQEAQSTLYVRRDGDAVHAAIEVKIARDWHLYHGPTREDMGPPEAIGKPTTVTFDGAEVTWQPVTFPEPEKVE